MKTDNASTFKIVIGLTVLVLIVAAVLGFLRSDGNAASAELAALSQAMPSQAARALSGDDASFDALDASVRQVASLRRSGAPGRSADWQQLETEASAILAGRTEVMAVATSAAQITADAAALLAGSDDLLGLSGATVEMQELQRRADRIRQTASRLPAAGDDAAASIAADVAWLRDAINGLNGEQTTLDILPLDERGRETAIVPLLAVMTSLEEQSASLGAGVGQVAALTESRARLDASAAALLDTAFAPAGGSVLPAMLDKSSIPLALLGVALLLVALLQYLHSRVAVFEDKAKVQSAQNERNQQAILRLLDEMGSLADGDLTVEATVTEDITGTIADSFNFAIEELRKLVATVNQTALMVDAATKQTENTAANLRKAADNQASEINAATDSIVSMAHSIEEVSGNAERSSDVARHSVEVAHKGGEAVRRTIDGMNTIRETIQETSKRIKRLGESSQEIGNIVELINDIAEQTNILALNASIQASMAGEAGRGFAVVADEVQRLAERSTNATKQIEVLVRTIQSDTNEAVVSMERSTTDVVGGALLAENAGAALDEIEQVSNQIASLVQNISGSAREQASAAADVTRRTTRLKEIGDQTGKATTATAASISKLSQLATELRKTVEGFALPPEMMRAGALTRATAAKRRSQPAAPPTPQAGQPRAAKRRAKTG
ncbi:MAG: methyl-accepting chemotaxis protein [Gammaproteobacteria bacterium]|nr:methyl-accepting chemotaxis protein [Gammaproteobacteria bacterium]MBT8093503.1 methyl-accepting chemotaxis protein [Gammaproteobacteria bacterium]NNL62538.1 methyl-accepting chemotaxis protein [Woeseiaceae bacterium]